MTHPPDAPLAIGSVGRALKANLRRLRTAKHLTHAQVAERLTKLGRPITTLSVGRTEAGRRRVDVDDLLAIAHALNVAPVDLLIPADVPGDTTYHVTPTTPTTVDVARDWIGGQGFLVEPTTPAELLTAIQDMPTARANAFIAHAIHRWPEIMGAL